MDVSDLYRTEHEGEGDEPRATVVLNIHVQPGAGRSAVVGRHGTALKVRVAAPPEGGRANEAAAALLGETFGLAPAGVELVGGAASRSKRFRLSGVDAGEFQRRLERAVVGGAGGGGGGGANRPK